ncbi:hypothetical protein KDL01_41200, partial [Actinospica durhamensis]
HPRGNPTAAHRDIGGHQPGLPLSASLAIRCPPNKVTSWPLTRQAGEKQSGEADHKEDQQ